MKINKNQDTALLTLRVLVGALIMLHGFGNLLSGYAFISQVLEKAGIPSFFAAGAFMGEILAPILLIIGFRTRLAALAIAATMLVATLLVHRGEIFALNQFGGWAVELQAFYFFGAIALFFSGAGRMAVSKSNEWD